MNLLKKEALVTQVLKGIGQIMLQENSLTGLLFLIGIFLGSWQMGVGGLLATLAGTLVARFLKYPAEEINQGLYGFSAALVGVALTFMFQSQVIIWVLVVLGGGLATVVQHFFIRKNIPVFTLPFIIITWCIVFLLHRFTDIPPSDVLSADIKIDDLDDFATSINGFGEVIFQGGFWSGVLFFAAVFISKPAAALYGLFASLLGAALSHHYGESMEQIHMGLFGFNVVLSAIVFAGFKKIDGFWVLVAILLTWFIDIVLVESNALDIFGGVLTFPFVAGTWITLIIKKYLDPVLSKITFDF
ncbi:urea transporter [Ornithobacterium rhinotracheale]